MPPLMHANTDERRTINRLMKYAEAQGWVVTVNDGVETVARNVSPNAARFYMTSTGQDVLMFQSIKTGQHQGFMLLVYGNTGDEVINDFSDNEAMNAAWQFVCP